MKLLFPGMLLLVVIFSACAGEDPAPENLISEDTYIDLMVELQLLETWYENAVSEVPLDSMRQEVFRKYDVDSTQFTISHNYYRQQLEEQKVRIGVAIDRLRRDRLEGRKAAEDSAAADSLRIDTTGAGVPDLDDAADDTTVVDGVEVDSAVADTLPGQ